jgi:hypothetical protein
VGIVVRRGALSSKGFGGGSETEDEVVGRWGSWWVEGGSSWASGEPVGLFPEC